jgi:hypothetical protein
LASANHNLNGALVDQRRLCHGRPRRDAVAIDAATGELLWLPDRRGARAAPRLLSGRGVAYWTDGRGDDRITW